MHGGIEREPQWATTQLEAPRLRRVSLTNATLAFWSVQDDKSHSQKKLNSYLSECGCEKHEAHSGVRN